MAVAAAAHPQLPHQERRVQPWGAGTAQAGADTLALAALPLPIGLALHLEMTAGGEVPPSLPLPWPQQVDTLSPGGAGWWQLLPLSGPIPVPLQPGGRPESSLEPGWARGQRVCGGAGVVGVREPSGREAGVGRAGFGESSLLWCLVWLEVSLTRTSEKMVCPSGRPTGACQVSALGPWGQQQEQPPRPPPGVGWGPQAQGGSVVPAPHLLVV